MVLSIAGSKCKTQEEKLFKEEELIEILNFVVLIKNI